MRRTVRISVAEYERLTGKKWEAPPEKRHKYGAKKCVIDGVTFASTWEAQCYVTLGWEHKAGVITEPLLQVPFSLGEWRPVGVKKPKEYFYVADFVYVDLMSGLLVVADAKGFETAAYKVKKKVFLDVYGFCITELKKLRLGKSAGGKHYDRSRGRRG